LQPYPVVATDAPIEIGATVISAVLPLDKHLSQTNTSCVPKSFYTSQCIVVLFWTSLSGYAPQNASRKAASDFDAR
jgi:hypothetical protein